MADEEKVKKLEKILNENAKKTEDKIKNLTEELDAERRKSMMDEQKAMNL
jgi:tRNA(Phe) wybutosine-synthesizing methylase Tyw3